MDFAATCLLIVLAPLAAAAIAGLGGRFVGRAGAHTLCIAGVAVSFAGSAWLLMQLLDGAPVFNQAVYVWGVSDGLRMEIGFLIDNLSALMMTVVTFVSLAVHVYTIGYMRDDPGYTRFFAYISLFTFAMLMLVMSNNFLQLFFGWEGVGLVSYLLIGFWYKRPTAIVANYKAFLVNRIGDFAFIVAIAIIVAYMGSLDYVEVFQRIPRAIGHDLFLTPGEPSKVITVICVGLFLGAMGKSAQVPLHVWLPDSMEGPTPISALIHAATMVTAGIFMVARLSPLFEMSPDTLHFIVVIGATTALFMGLLGLVNNDIKRVVAYSTLSQLGYMTAALGAGAYGAGIFHLMTHAFFKALLFLAAGSVIIGMHHEQDMRRMGGLRKYMPITYWTCLIGSLALIGFPGFSGFFSKDIIIESLRESATEGAGYAYWCALIGVFVTALYSFRLVFMTFHGKERMDEHTREHLHESPWVVTLPLIALAIPSIAIGWLTVGPGRIRGLLPGRHRAGAGRPDRAARGGVPRAGGIRHSFARVARPLPRARRRRCGLVPVPEAARPAGPHRCALPAHLPPARQQVLLRLVLRKRDRERRAELRHEPLEAGRRDRHRRLARQRQRARGRRTFRRRAPGAVGLPLPLRLRDDHRLVAAARLAPLEILRWQHRQTS